jgi:hypothetical protein
MKLGTCCVPGVAPIDWKAGSPRRTGNRRPVAGPSPAHCEAGASGWRRSAAASVSPLMRRAVDRLPCGSCARGAEADSSQAAPPCCCRAESVLALTQARATPPFRLPPRPPVYIMIRAPGPTLPPRDPPGKKFLQKSGLKPLRLALAPPVPSSGARPTPGILRGSLRPTRCIYRSTWSLVVTVGHSVHLRPIQALDRIRSSSDHYIPESFFRWHVAGYSPI